MSSLGQRMIRAAKLDTSLYEEVESDAGAMGQAMGVVVLSSVAAGIGLGGGSLVGLTVGAVISLLGWYVWAFLTFIIGTKLLPEPQTHADVGQLLRTTGFSSSPGILRVLGVVPGFGALVQFIVGVWMLVAMVIAVRQALDYHSTGRAVGVCLIGWLVQLALVLVVQSLV